MYSLKQLIGRVLKPSHSSSASSGTSAKEFPCTLTDQAKADYNSSRPIGFENTVCSAAVKNMYFTRTGAVHSCCHNRDHVIGVYPQQTIEQIWNGAKAEELRSRLSCYNLSSGCQICQYDIDRKAFRETKASHFDMLPKSRQLPIMMEFELDITCNLECSMCSGEFSSLIRKNKEGRAPLHSPYDAEFVAQLRPFLSTLKEARFSGGEPFLIPIYHDIWAELSRYSPNCLISVQTNGTVFNNRVRNALYGGRFEIGVSLDSLTKEVFETIRKGAKFEVVMENIEHFSAYCKEMGTPFRLSMCVMRNNWHEMPQYLEHCNRLEAYVSFHRVNTPLDQSLWNLPSSELFQIHRYLADHKPAGGGSPVVNDNLRHYQAYTDLILEWANAQLGREKEQSEWECLDTDQTVARFISIIDNKVSNDDPIKDRIPELLRSMFDLLPQGNLRQVVINLKDHDHNVIIQRLRLRNTDQLVEELKTIYPDLVE